MPDNGYTTKEVVARGKEIYREQIQEQVEPQEKGKFVAIDILSGDYEVDPEHIPAVQRIRKRRPDAELYVGRVGYPSAYQFRRPFAVPND